MPVPAIKNSTTVALQVVTNKIKGQLAENQLHAVNGAVKEKVTETSKKNPVDGRFTITFSYNKNLHRTQVLTSKSGYGTQVYKVALNSVLSNESRICWLQKSPQGWVVLLGEDINPKLRNAITTAIENQA